MTAYYNEIDLFAAEWLRNLIAAGHIAPGDVDTRSIAEVRPDDLAGYTQCHFFAGIGGWSLAARLAGWPDDRPLWTGSCPCQPFSAAGKRLGTDDERHLWPVFERLIAECRPPVVAGEQVASKAGRAWLAGVRADLEALGYGVGAADLCAASIGAPHIWQRLWWVADAGQLRSRGPAAPAEEESRRASGVSSGRGFRGGLAYADSGRAERLAGDDAEAARVQEAQREPEHGPALPERGGADRGGRRGAGESGGLGDAVCTGLEGQPGHEHDGHEPGRVDADAAGSAAEAGGDCWGGAIYIPCADGKARRIEPGIEPLAHGIPGRVGRLRAYGNAIVPQVAAEFLLAYLESAGE